MGLDISVYERVELIKACTVEERRASGEEEADDERLLYAADFSNRTDGMVDGVYRISGKLGGFRAGSYSGYNRWRADLARLIGTTDRAVWALGDNANGPFVELIHMSDCEGFIGPKTSAKLASDFVEWRERAAVFAAGRGDAGYWLKKYDEWQEAFALAAGGGVVRFA